MREGRRSWRRLLLVEFGLCVLYRMVVAKAPHLFTTIEKVSAREGGREGNKCLYPISKVGLISDSGAICSLSRHFRGSLVKAS
jgi:hypothetical protein